MRLAAKLTAALVLGFCAVTLPFSWFQVRREVGLFEQELAKDQRSMGRTLRLAIQGAWRTEGENGALDLIRRANDTIRGVRFRWVWLDDGPADAGTTPTVGRTRLVGIPDDGDRMVIAPDESGSDRRFTYVPVPLPDGRRGGLELSESLVSQRAFLRATKLQILVSSAVYVVLSSLLAMLLGFSIVGAPMQRLAQKARRVGQGDLTGRLDESQTDEIGELARELNAMCDQLEAAQRRIATETEARIATVEQLRHADRLKTVGQLASGIAHELGTPLNVVAARAKMIASADARAGDAQTNARIIAEQAGRMTTIIRQLLDFSRRRGPLLRDTDLRHLTEQTATLVTPLADKRGVRIQLETSATPVQADQSQLQQVLTNVMVNGIQAMANGGVLRVAVDEVEATPPEDHGGPTGRWARFRVGDEGVGIAPEHLPKIFEPFFTTKGVGEGTGLGLSVAYGIVRDHGGWIAVDSAPGRGTTFSIFLPTAHGAPSATAHEGAA